MSILSKKTFFLILGDFLLLTIAFLIAAWIKPATFRVYIPNYFEPFLLFSLLWMVVGFVVGKFNFKTVRSRKDLIVTILISNITAFSILIILIYYLAQFSSSRIIVFGTIGFATIFEIIVAVIIAYYIDLNRSFLFEERKRKRKIMQKAISSRYEAVVPDIETKERSIAFSTIKEVIEKETTKEIAEMICNNFPICDPHFLMLSTTTRFNIETKPSDFYQDFVNLKRLNDFRYLNKYFETVNSKLPEGGRIFGFVETYFLRKQRILRKFPAGLNYIYYFFDFLFWRVFPKIILTRRFYFSTTRGRNRVLSKAETFGRLYSCGFHIEKEAVIDGKLCFIAKKVKEPVFDMNPTYGPLIRLKRVGKNRKIIGVYKMRTMHAYSEYLQPYVYERNKLKDGGKFDNDFRITTFGAIMRKTWIDELPMILNFLKRDLKIVGVRPLSNHYFGLYSKEMQEYRTKVKPGLVPPFYADMPKTIEEVQESEKKYIDSYLEKPFTTDCRYFFLAFYNIVIKKARSG